MKLNRKLIIGLIASALPTFAQNLPWENTLDTIQRSMTGPVVEYGSIIAVVVGALGYAVSPEHSGMRKAATVLGGLGVALNAPTVINAILR